MIGAVPDLPVTKLDNGSLRRYLLFILSKAFDKQG